MRFLPTPRRRLLLAALSLAWASLAWPAGAQGSDFPSKPVTVYTAFAVGSGPDAVLRLVANRLALQWKQSVTVDNRPGGGGFIAIEAARRAAPDGHSLVQLDSEHLAALPSLYKSRNFDTLKAFDPVAPLFRTPFMVAVSAQSPWKNVSDLLAAAKAKPGSVSYGSWGVGSPGHLGAEWLEMLTGVEMVHAPYKEVSQLYTSVANGDVAWSFASIPSSQGVYKAGKLRYLAVAAPKRIPQLPEVPTVAEAGGPAALDVNSFVSLLAPKGVPAPVRAKIHADVLKVLAEPEVRERFNTFAFEPLNWSVDEILKNADTKAQQYQALIKKANISLD
ncbi:tripartite tricarboxylate transporter substrate binding protein [Curvibacter sp. HBC28]|uniref:Tripartite tricarboxylate transporter substrate binding protein n=1 Tax=Curvibacter microcysteis TaxID=3026419 RepID=A0ABT5MGX8_9BURK|nr:tripartite tricarboxylate transporter substrate binding protein [Curvibacter sp. HBC28]MDD0815162.1 tripartite tricarboxylate transporter substrate binding protein [Curvibacter sp. HBC28]